MHAVSWVMGACVLFACPAVADEQPTLDELLNLEPPAGAEVPADSDTASPTDDIAAPDVDLPVDADLEDALTQDQINENFAQAVREMAEVTRQLDQRDAGLSTQRLQQRILDRLQQLIDAASQASPPPSGGGSGQPQPGNQDNTQNQPGQGQQGQQPQPGQGQRPQPGAAQPGGAQPNQGEFSPGSVGPVEPDAKSLDELRSEWGALPPRLRDELSDGLDEPYSPVYRAATERYYRRLAEEAGR